MTLAAAPEDLPTAVIVQAWRDAGLAFAEGQDGKNALAKRLPISRADRLAARLFLTAEAGDWARARADWCLAAGVDPDIIRRQALKAFGW